MWKVWYRHAEVRGARQCSSLRTPSGSKGSKALATRIRFHSRSSRSESPANPNRRRADLSGRGQFLMPSEGSWNLASVNVSQGAPVTVPATLPDSYRAKPGSTWNIQVAQLVMNCGIEGEDSDTTRMFGGPIVEPPMEVSFSAASAEKMYQKENRHSLGFPWKLKGWRAFMRR